MDKTFELPRQNHVHEQKGQTKGDREIGVRFGKGLGPSDKFPAVLRRQVHCFHKITQADNRFTKRIPLQIGRNDNLPLPSKPVYGVGAKRPFQSNHGSQTGYTRGGFGGRNRQPGNCLGIASKIPIGPQPDIIKLIKLAIFGNR